MFLLLLCILAIFGLGYYFGNNRSKISITGYNYDSGDTYYFECSNSAGSENASQCMDTVHNIELEKTKRHNKTQQEQTKRHEMTQKTERENKKQEEKTKQHKETQQTARENAKEETKRHFEEQITTRIQLQTQAEQEWRKGLTNQIEEHLVFLVTSCVFVIAFVCYVIITCVEKNNVNNQGYY